MDDFKVENVESLSELRATATLVTHPKSGARILHVLAPQDSENCFAVTFPTPPTDDTGLPHIMEHSVLAGSDKFPVRDPFFELVNMSMATFINAMTGQAYTVYPVSSNVRKDFFNLVDVYLDAVFHPRLTEDTFRREGHHLTLHDNADLDSPMKVSGIVYNEMKGAYSSAESLMYRMVDHGLYPDTPLGRDSGGDPDFIPDLTYAQFMQFHKNVYHPSNALFFLYGDIALEDHLACLGPVLNDFDAQPAPVATPRQPRWSAPVCREGKYPIGQTDEAEMRSYFAFNWLVGDALDPQQVTDWEVLSRLLVGNDAAPLRKAIVDSKLGADVFFSGTWATAYEQEFHVGLKGSSPDRVDAFEALVLETLAQIADTPFEPERVDAALQQLAYSTLEVNSLFPLHVMNNVTAAWPYGADPLMFLHAQADLEDCRKRFASDPTLFNRLVKNALIDNPHRLRVMLVPDRDVQGAADAAFAKKMATKRAGLSEKQIAEVARAAAELDAAQNVQDPPEALAKLPQLQTRDLPDTPRMIPTSVDTVAGMTVLRNDVFANGVNYLDVDVDLAGLPEDLYAWLPLYNDVFSKLGAAGQDYAAIAERREACTGGLWSHASVSRHATDPTQCMRRMRIGLKTLDREAAPALDLLNDLIFSLDPCDHERLGSVMKQSRAWQRTNLVNDGLQTATRQAARGLNLMGHLQHQFLSPESLGVFEGLTDNFDACADEIMSNVKRIQEFMLERGRWTVSFTGSDSVYDLLLQSLAQLGTGLRDSSLADVLPAFEPYAACPREGLAGAMQVAYCAQVMRAPHLGDPDVPLLTLGVRLANFDYLLPAIRLRGNAYGAGARLNDGLGTLSLYSFRDPNIVETLDAFDGLRDFVAQAQWSQVEIDRAIIGSAKDAEKPIRPREATASTLYRYLRGDTDALRATRYAALLAATPEGVKETFLRVLDAHWDDSAICVASSRKKLDEANARLGKRALDVSAILRKGDA